MLRADHVLQQGAPSWPLPDIMRMSGLSTGLDSATQKEAYLERLKGAVD